MEANLAAVDPIVACVLGDNCEAGEQAAACANVAPASLDGQCVPEVLAGTGCTTSSCVAPKAPELFLGAHL